jgi:hypothetical protein
MLVDYSFYFAFRYFFKVLVLHFQHFLEPMHFTFYFLFCSSFTIDYFIVGLKAFIFFQFIAVSHPIFWAFGLPFLSPFSVLFDYSFSFSLIFQYFICLFPPTQNHSLHIL